MQPTITDAGRTYLRWALTDGIGPLLFSRVLVQFGDAETALGASAGRLAEIRRIGPKSAERIACARDAVEIDAEIEAAAKHGVRILCRADAEYPPGLREIADAPIVLYVKGELQPGDAVALAIVGTRRCSIYGSEQARRFGELLAGTGFTVVSGLARGIDAFAHHGAVDAGGRSIAVMGKGLPEIYPPENQALAEKVLEHGAWISELPMQAEVHRENFPGRNRIIAGMTLGTLVIEAPQRSGALITARLANEYNREVFAIPGRVQDPLAFGSNDLIRRGYAKLTACLEDILEELGAVGERMRPAPAEQPAGDVTAGSSGDCSTGETAGPSGSSDVDRTPPLPGRSPHLTGIQKRVYEVIGYEPMFQDAVLRASQLPPGEVLAAFTALELKGLVKRLPGQLIVRVGHA